MTNDHWYKSSYSSNHGGNCVECRTTEIHVQVRDTQNRAAGYLSFHLTEWSAFLTDLRTGEL